jgi:hypothetical protein
MRVIIQIYLSFFKDDKLHFFSFVSIGVSLGKKMNKEKDTDCLNHFSKV